MLQQHRNFYQKSTEYEVEKKIILRQIFSALRFLEEKGICHFDLKPENFVFKNPLSTELKMVDFDFMSRCPNEEGKFRFCGTPCFYAPELLYQRCRGKLCDQSKRDIWAAGLIAIEIFSGVEYDWGCGTELKSEKDKRQLENVIMDHTEMIIPRIPVPLDRDMKELIVHLLVKSPKDRWTAAQAFSSPYFVLPEYTEPEDGIEIILVPQHEKIKRFLRGKPLTMRVSPSISVSALMDQIMLKYGIRKSSFSLWYKEINPSLSGILKKIGNIKKPLESYHIQEGDSIYLNVKDLRHDP